MIATLRLEAIGDNLRKLRNMSLRAKLFYARRLPAEERSALFTEGWRPWVAELMATGARTRRLLLDGMRDYREMNKTGSRGIFYTFILEPFTLSSWTAMRRYFCRADAGAVVEMTPEQAVAWLEERASGAQRTVDRAACR